MSKILAIIGIIATLSYAIFIFWIFGLDLAKLRGLSPNELGDFLAGVFGPMALLWLILGYFQQGIELRQNTEALEIQAKELKASVEQQAKLVKIQQSQVTLEKEQVEYSRRKDLEENLPLFGFSNPSIGSETDGVTLKSRLSVENVTCREINITSNFAKLGISPNRFEVLRPAQSQSIKFRIDLANENKDNFEIEIRIAYLCSGINGAKKFVIPIQKQGNRYTALTILDPNPAIRNDEVG